MTLRTEPIDMAYDGGLRETALDLERRYGIEVEVVNANGPAGGWPEVVLAGERADIERALREQWSMGDPQADDEFVAAIMESLAP